MDRLRSAIEYSGLEWSELVYSLPDTYLIVGRDGNILFINRKADTASEDVLSRTVFDYTASDFHPQLAEKLKRVFDSGSDERIEVRRSDREPAGDWWSIAMTPLRNDNKIVAAVFLCREVTDLENIRQEQQRALNILKEKYWREISAHDRARELLVEEIEVRRQVEHSLRESEERHRALLENARNAIYSVNYEGYFVFLNPVAARDLGGVPKSYEGRHMTDLFPPEIASRQLASIRRVIDNRQGESREALTIIGGHPKWYITSIQPLVDSEGNCGAALLESTDIDNRVRATQQLERERNFSSTILKTANSLIVCLDQEARILVFNTCAEETTGYKFEEVVGKSWPELFLPTEDQEQRFEKFNETLRSHPRASYEGRVKCRSGEIRTVHWSGTSLTLADTGELIGIGIGVDITESKRAQEKLRESEERFSLAMAGAEVGLWDWNMSTNEVYYSPNWKAMLGYNDHEVENSFMGWKRLWHPDDASRIERAIDDYLTGKTKQYEVEYRLLHKDGKWRWFLTRGGVFKDASGKPYRWVGTNIDISHLREMEIALREKNEELDYYFRSSLDLLCIANVSGEFLRLNPEWEKVLGYSLSELEGRSFLDLVHPDDLESTRNALAKLESQEEVLNFENRYRCKDGSYRWIEWKSRAVGPIIYAAARDVTERNRMREQLITSRERSSAILRGLPDLVFVIDRNGFYREFTGGYRDDLLVPAEEVVGSHISDAISKSLADEMMKLLNKAISEGTSEMMEYDLELASGTTNFEARFVRCGVDECLVIVRNISQRKRMEREVAAANESLRLEHIELNERNIALRVVLSQVQQQVDLVKSQIHENVERLIIPAISRFRESAAPKDRGFADQIESLLIEITSSFAGKLQNKSANLTTREIEICNMIKKDCQSKEIAEELNLSIRTVEKFRQRIRTKLGIANQDINLATFLKSL